MANNHSVMPEHAWVNQVRQVMREVQKRQGYIVIGFPKAHVDRLSLPWRVTKLFQFEMRAEFEAFATASEWDWEMQNALIASLRRDWIPVPANRGEQYFKVRVVR
jgi:hypothetical protein